MFGPLRLVMLGLLAAQSAFAAPDAQKLLHQDDAATGEKSAALKLKVSASFPAAEVFGIKLVNGYPTEAVLNFTNNEPDPVTIQFIGGSLLSPEIAGQDQIIVRNLTTTAYNHAIEAGKTQSLVYKFTTEMHPADLKLRLISLAADSKGTLHRLASFDGEVSVVEAPTSLLDPQVIFLYLVLAGAFAGTAYFIYSTWITTLFPQQKKRPAKSADKPKATPRKAAEPIEAAAGSGSGYDESWIPKQHLEKRGDSNKVRGGTPSGVKTKRAA